MKDSPDASEPGSSTSTCATNTTPAQIAYAEERASRVWAVPEICRAIFEALPPSTCAWRLRVINRATFKTYYDIKLRAIHLEWYKKLVQQLIARERLDMYIRSIRTLDITGTIMGSDVPDVFEYFKIIPTLSTVRWAGSSLTREPSTHRRKPLYTCVRSIEYTEGEIDLPTSVETASYTMYYAYQFSLTSWKDGFHLPKQLLASQVSSDPRPTIKSLTFMADPDWDLNEDREMDNFRQIQRLLDVSILKDCKELKEITIGLTSTDIRQFTRFIRSIPKSCQSLTIRNLNYDSTELLMELEELVLEDILQLPSEFWRSMSQIRHLSIEAYYVFAEDPYIYPSIRPAIPSFSAGSTHNSSLLNTVATDTQSPMPYLSTLHLNLYMWKVDTTPFDRTLAYNFFAVPEIASKLLRIGGFDCNYTVTINAPDHTEDVRRLLSKIVTEALRREINWIRRAQRRDKEPGWRRVKTSTG